MAEAAAAAPAAWLVDKPAGPTSHDVVAEVRRALGRGTRAGHAGTLDPFATGLLVVLSGRATRLARYLSGLDKRYAAVVRLGWTSVSGDPEGPVTRCGTPPAEAEVREAVAGLVGPQRQRVPALAAVKVGGEPLYRRTRRGEVVDVPEREVVVHAIALTGFDAAEGLARLEVSCSKGTYLRALAADLGERLGCGGYCVALRRTAVGGLVVGDAVAPGVVPAGGRREPLAVLGHLAQRELTRTELADVAHGRALPASGAEDGPVALAHAGSLVAVAEADGEGRLCPRVVLAPAPGAGG